MSESLELTCGDAAAAMGGQLLAGDPDRLLDGVSIDTRTLRGGDLYFAIRGERLDGHAFVADAWMAGAGGIVVADPSAAVRPRDGAGAVVIVGETTRALQALAREVRRRSGARVVAITGSAGKTTTKEITAALLEAQYRVFRNVGNLNNHIGLPLSLLALRARPEVAVVELGMNHAGEISTLVRIAEPDVRVWTNVAPVHAAFFPSIGAIADAKAEIFEGAGPDSVLVTNANDIHIMERVARFAGRVITFGVDVDAGVRASNVEELGLAGMRALVATPQGEITLTTPLLGHGNLANVLAATAVAQLFEVPLAAIAARVATLRPASRRGEVRQLGGGVVVIDDSYNSNPVALQRALAVLRREGQGRRRIAVLGEMRELGAAAVELHEACGRAAAEAGVDLLFTVGGDAAEALGQAAIAAGLLPDHVHHFATSEEAAAFVVRWVAPGDLVLVKGSRGTRTDLVVDRLAGELG